MRRRAKALELGGVAWVEALEQRQLLSTTVQVPGTSDPWRLSSTSPAQDGTDSPVIDLPAGTGRVLSFSNVTGRVSFEDSQDGGPDGQLWGPASNTPVGGISGVNDSDRNSFFALLGVFTQNTVPSDNPPPTLDYGVTENNASFSPLVDQVFFVGDGLTGTGSGATQVFHVPDGATRLYLGFADGGYNQVSFYTGNGGSLSVTATVTVPTHFAPSPVSQISGIEGHAIGPVALATFTDPAGAAALGGYSASVNWGDGSAIDNGATISYDAGKGIFTVLGNHVYADESSTAKKITVTITPPNSAAVAVSDTALVHDAALVAGPSLAFSVTQNTTLSKTLGTFTDQNPLSTNANDYIGAGSVISWGDGVTTPLTAANFTHTGGNSTGSFWSVAGTHKYTTTGTKHAAVTVHDIGGASTTFNVTITVVPPVPTLSVNNVSLSEGNSGLKPFTFTVTRTGDLTKTTTVHYATADGTAKAGSDYNAATGLLTFAAKQATATITVQVRGDLTYEANETYTVVLSSPTNGSILNHGTGTIVNDDPTPPKLSIGGYSTFEGNSGTTAFIFKLTLDKAGVTPITVNFATSNGTAIAGSDYIAASGKVTFNAGETFKTITIYVNGDKTKESDETFLVKLSAAVNATIAVGSAMGTIRNDD